MITIKLNGTDITSYIDWRSLSWTDNLTNRVNTLDFSITAESLLSIDLDDEVTLEVDGTKVFGGRVVSYEDTIQGAYLLTRKIKCKDYTVEMDNFYYSGEHTGKTGYYLIRDLLHTINKRRETRLARFETNETWSGGSADTTNYRDGSQSLKLTSSGSYITASYNPASAIDISGETYILFDTYINDTAPTSIRIKFGDTGLANYYYYEITSIDEEWTQHKISKSDFTSVGSPDWSAIAEIEVAYNGNGDCSFDDIYALDNDGFTMDGVNADAVLDSVYFGYKLPSAVLKRYAQMLGYDWYVDANRDIQFFSAVLNTAPFELTDTAGNHIYNSLKISKDISKLRNVVYIFGGEAVADNNTTEDLSYQADGTNTQFQLARDYDLDTVTLTINTTTQSVGEEGTDTFADGFDVLYNKDDKTLNFNTAPASGDTVTWTGKRLFKLTAKISDAVSISKYGEKEITIKEDDLVTFTSAIQRAIAEFTEYASENINGTFKTYESGLRAGQRLHIDLSSKSIDEWYIIQKITGKMRTATEMEYTVQLVSTNQYGIIEILQMLLADRMKDIKDYTSEYLVGGSAELVEVSEDIEASTGTDLTDEAEVSDTNDYWLLTTGDPLSYVAGNYEPTSNTDTTRTPCADGGAKLSV